MYIHLSKMRLLILAVALLCSSKIFAQQEPQFTQYMYDLVSVNPAYAGTNDRLNALMLTRQQWVGLDGAPVTYVLSVHSPIINYNMGLGLSVITESYGPVSNTYVNLNYSYRVKLDQKLTLAMGLKAGIYNYYANLTSLDVSKVGEDPIFQDNLVKTLTPNVGLGFYLFHKDYYAGIAAPKLIESELSSSATSDNTMSDLKRHFYIIGGYTYQIDKEWIVKPSMLMKVVAGAPLSVDLTAQGGYQDKYWLGLSYRYGDAIAVLLDYQVMPYLLVGYSYDYTLTNLSNYNSGTHEVLLSFNFDPFFMKKKARSTVYIKK